MKEQYVWTLVLPKNYSYDLRKAHLLASICSKEQLYSKKQQEVRNISASIDELYNELEELEEHQHISSLVNFCNTGHFLD